MPSLEQAHAFNSAYEPRTRNSSSPTSPTSTSDGKYGTQPYVPTMVVFGGTSGIGKAIARRFATLLGGKLRLVVVGRNKEAAEALFATLPPTAASTTATSHSPSTPYSYEFISCDISSMRAVRTTCASIAQKYGKINYLVMTSGKAFGSWKRGMTDEGVEQQLALRFYWKFAVLQGLVCVFNSSFLSLSHCSWNFRIDNALCYPMQGLSRESKECWRGCQCAGMPHRWPGTQNQL